MSKYPEIESKMKKDRGGAENSACISARRKSKRGGSRSDHCRLLWRAHPIQQVASISVPDPRSLMIQPWDASVLKGH